MIKYYKSVKSRYLSFYGYLAKVAGRGQPRVSYNNFIYKNMCFYDNKYNKSVKCKYLYFYGYPAKVAGWG